MKTDAEIAVLEALAAHGESLESKTGACTPQFRARLRLVDRARRLLVLDRCSNEAANMALVAQPRAELRAEWGEWRIAFVAGNPVTFSHEGTAAIRLDFPESVEIGRRRIYERTPDPLPPLRCLAEASGTVILETSVKDMSLGGLGLDVDIVASELKPGMFLAACRLECPGWEPAIVDLEVRHTTTAIQPDGSRSTRIGCRFVNLSPAAMVLVARYVNAGKGVRNLL